MRSTLSGLSSSSGFRSRMISSVSWRVKRARGTWVSRPRLSRGAFRSVSWPAPPSRLASTMSSLRLPDQNIRLLSSRLLALSIHCTSSRKSTSFRPPVSCSDRVWRADSANISYWVAKREASICRL